jgi:hypothetical protein
MYRPSTCARLATALLGAAVAPSSVAHGQGTAETPELVARQFLTAIRDTNWFRAASLMHPSALAQFHDLFSPILQCENATAGQIRVEVFGVHSKVEAARASDTSLVASLLRYGTTREEGMLDVLRTAQMRVVGHVAEGGDTVHVLARLSLKVDSIPVSQMEVISFRRYGNTWRTLLKSDFSAMGAMLRRLCVKSS